MGGSASKQLLSQLNDVLQSVFNNIMASSSTSITNYVSAGNKIKLHVKGTFKCGSVFFDQVNNIKLNYKNELTVQDITSLKTKLSSEIDNKTSQTMKIVREFLGSFGSFNSDDNITMIQSRLKQIINNQVTISHENKILNETVALNGIDLTIDGDWLVEGACVWKQSTLIDIASSAMVNDLIQTCVDDDIVSRIVNDSKQKFDLEEKGPASFLVAIALVIFALAMFAKEGLKAVTDYRLWLLVALALLVAFIFKFFPFKRKQTEFWGCGKNTDGYNTGQCIQYDNPTRGPFYTQALCEKSKDNACPQFFGCQKDNGFNTGQCTQFTTPLLGPYRLQGECEELASRGDACKRYFSCGTDTKGFNLSPPTCVEYRAGDPYLPDIIFPTQTACEESKTRTCSKHFSCDNAKHSCVEVYNSPYLSNEECSRNCR
jgi:hypothetical protein